MTRQTVCCVFLLTIKEIMLESLMSKCSDLKEYFQTARVVLLEENTCQNTDFIVVGWLLHELALERSVTFLAFR